MFINVIDRKNAVLTVENAILFRIAHLALEIYNGSSRVYLTKPEGPSDPFVHKDLNRGPRFPLKLRCFFTKINNFH